MIFNRGYLTNTQIRSRFRALIESPEIGGRVHLDSGKAGIRWSCLHRRSEHASGEILKGVCSVARDKGNIPLYIMF